MAYKASGAAYASTLAPIYPTMGNSRATKGESSSGRRGDTDMSRIPRLTTNDMRWAGSCRPHVPRLSARLTFPQSARLVVGTSSTKWRSLPSSLWLALDVQAAPRRKGAAAEYPGVGKGLRQLVYALGSTNLRKSCTHF